MTWRRFGPVLCSAAGLVVLAVTTVEFAGRPARMDREAILADLGVYWNGALRLPGVEGSAVGAKADTLRSEPGVRRAVASVRRSIEELPEPQRSSQIGFVDLVRSRAAPPGLSPGMEVDRAVEAFERAVAAEPENASYLTDLAVAYFERGRNGHEAGDLLDALRAIRLAHRLEPTNLEAAFNRARILEALSLWWLAAEAWEEYLELDPSSIWTGDARLRLDELVSRRRSSDTTAIGRQVLEFAEAGDARRLEDLVARHPSIARQVGERQLFSDWAQEIAEGRLDGAERIRMAVQKIGRALEQSTSDYFLSDAIALLATERPGQVEAGLVAGFRSYGEGVELVNRFEHNRAEPLLREAAGQLAGSPGPLLRAVTLYLALCSYQSSDYETALIALDELASESDAARYPALLARVRRVQALIHVLWGSYSQAFELYRAAIEAATAGGDVEAAVASMVSLARAYDLAGAPEKAWQIRLEALSERQRLDDPLRSYLLLAGAAAGLRDGRPELAEPFQDEAVAVAEAIAQPTVLVEAFRARSLIRSSLGRPEEALADLDRATAWAERVEDPDVRLALVLDNRRFAGRVLAAVDPPAAKEALDAAIAEAGAAGYRVVLPAMLVDRARLEARVDPSGAVELYRTAIAETERQRGTLNDAAARIDFADQAHIAHREIAALLIEQGDPDAALLEWERGRARALRDQLESTHVRLVDGGHTRSRTVEEIAAAIPDGTAVVEYAVLGEEAVAWVLRRDRPVADVRLPEPADGIEALVTGLYQDLGPRGSADRFGERLGELYRVLVLPVAAALDGVETLAIVPDRFLAAVPYSSLIDAATGRPLFAERIVVIAPSAVTFLELSGRGARRSVERPNALVVGDPAFDPRLAPGLARLPGAHRAAEEILGLYGGRSRLLVAESATSEAIAEAAPGADVVHLGAHTLIDREGRAAPSILLAPSEQGRSRLSAADVTALDLGAAQLVVLAVCDGASGPQSASEGTLSLVRPFLARGVPSVVASLWPVEDAAAAELMVDFHRRVAAGEPPAQALAAAKRSWFSGRSDGTQRLLLASSFEPFGGI